MLMNDGNFALVDAAGNVLLSTSTAGKGGTRVVLQNDGNIVLYNASNGIVWQYGSTSVC
jgi:hypothetical protein